MANLSANVLIFFNLEFILTRLLLGGTIFCCFFLSLVTSVGFEPMSTYLYVGGGGMLPPFGVTPLITVLGSHTGFDVATCKKIEHNYFRVCYRREVKIFLKNTIYSCNRGYNDMLTLNYILSIVKTLLCQEKIRTYL